MAPLCRAVPLLVCPLLVVGCFDAHTNDDPCRADAWVCCDPGRFGEPAPTGCPLECPRGYRLVPRGECGHDAGLPVLDAWVPPPPIEDAGPPPVPDAGLTCPAHRAFAACSPTPGLVAVRGEPFALPYRMDECGCCPRTECAVVDVDPDRRVLSLVTTLCPDPCDCIDCNPVEGACEVPGLPVAGDWEVRVNDAPAITLPVRESAGGPANPPGCGTFAEDDGCGPSAALTPNPWTPSDVCVRRAFGREVVELRNDCWGCDLQGPCITWLEPAPGGGTIHVAPSHYEPTCTDGICDGSCHELVRHCEIPELPEGDGVFDVVVDGVVRATLGRGAEAMRTTPCTGG